MTYEVLWGFLEGTEWGQPYFRNKKDASCTFVGFSLLGL